jgi:hypothetical protein
MAGAAGRVGLVGGFWAMHASDAKGQIRYQPVEGLAQRFTPAYQHIVMRRNKVIGTRCHSCAKAPLDAVALGRVARFLGHGKTNAGRGLGRGDGLQPKRRAPGAIAPGSPNELASLLQAAQSACRLIHGRHPARRP